jgi:hypothetical protein
MVMEDQLVVHLQSTTSLGKTASSADGISQNLTKVQFGPIIARTTNYLPNMLY